nr:RNA-directed DNA polymerase, eukaryota [Tanacetum cinerariifolium]
MPGRPQKSRIKHPCKTSGSHTSRVGRAMTCTNCWQKGHNKASCKADPTPKPPFKKKPPGRNKPSAVRYCASRGRDRGRGGSENEANVSGMGGIDEASGGGRRGTRGRGRRVRGMKSSVRGEEVVVEVIEMLVVQEVECVTFHRQPMLAPGNYVQWKSRIKRYIDTKPYHELIHYCLENPPYKLDWQDIEVPVSEGSPITTTERIRETYKNVSQEIRDQLNVEAEAVQIILTGIDNDIYSTVDACPNACEMWKVIERLKQGESINVQDLETNLNWEFGKFTSQDGETLESYYS